MSPITLKTILAWSHHGGLLCRFKCVNSNLHPSTSQMASIHTSLISKDETKVPMTKTMLMDSRISQVNSANSALCTRNLPSSSTKCACKSRNSRWSLTRHAVETRSLRSMSFRVQELLTNLRRRIAKTLQLQMTNKNQSRLKTPNHSAKASLPELKWNPMTVWWMNLATTSSPLPPVA